MKRNESYIRQESEIAGKHTVFTEIEINASPEIVRSTFLDFSKWHEWSAVIPQIAVKSGDINKPETKPTIELTLDFGRKGDPAKAPVYPKIYDNDKEVFSWGFSIGILKAVHVFIFEPINKGKETRLVHYEKMTGILKSLAMTKKVKADMTERYNIMNEAFKKVCEE